MSDRPNPEEFMSRIAFSVLCGSCVSLFGHGIIETTFKTREIEKIKDNTAKYLTTCYQNQWKYSNFMNENTDNFGSIVRHLIRPSVTDSEMHDSIVSLLPDDKLAIVTFKMAKRVVKIHEEETYWKKMAVNLASIGVSCIIFKYGPNPFG